ncbi:uncharacterized protein CTHT_0060120 [Thermochaetoides thermophila DSM 1495]|uniref:Uncharacterized protein n=1 Tax=Chaetomium thermophilum (strain DSM 1495 / CBS 144.50 / IMI 039719) TaxID=759272 RepID=G0SEY3_CHATD|nr:hypothetical protein CTHT_0060120 [Thermochaetoides thermophila DSM 1495]EGS17999.1 hypothetical protein CTHT_0060120 [Thermochaetoides thermophila DSM 1495]
MGAAVSTLVGWTVVIGCIYIVGFGLPGKKKTRESLRGSQRHRLEEKQHTQHRKEPKEKAKRQRVESFNKDAEKTRTQKPASVPVQAVVDTSSDDEVDNREFARQLASVKQGTSLNAPKKSDEKRTKSVKQSRAQVFDDEDDKAKAVSAPSSTAGVDADDDESSTPSPEVRAVDAGDVSDMLEPKPAGPSVLRLTDTDKVKPKKEKKAKTPEKTETKKQRQNRKKAEAEKALREENEKQRKADMEAQRRQARIAEGRPAKDGSTFQAQQQANAWTSNGTKDSPSSNATNGEFVPVQPLDTFDSGSFTDVSVPKSTSTPAKSTAPAADNWIASLPSEEEQMEMLREEEAWSTVTTKKSRGKKKEAAAAAATTESAVDSEPTVVQGKTVANKLAANSAAAPAPKANKPKKPAISQPSAFAALSTDDENIENEWDV